MNVWEIFIGSIDQPLKRSAKLLHVISHMIEDFDLQINHSTRRFLGIKPPSLSQ